jgi:predicted ester cyclase
MKFARKNKHPGCSWIYSLVAASMLFPVVLIVMPVRAAVVDDATAITMAKPQETIVAPGMAPTETTAVLKPVEAFYGFWINGSADLLRQALSPQFIDHTLPPGRPQGPTGPAIASKAFLTAVPDLQMAVVQRLVVGDRVVSHLHFTGHFTGTFQDVHGAGQPVSFIATDIVRVRNGRITDNWHLEDNLTFLKQIGLIPAK